MKIEMAGMDKKNFQAPYWLLNPHLQTLWGALMRSRPRVNLRAERLELSDGDFLDLVWVGQTKNTPIVIILHGLNGGVDSGYAMGMLDTLEKQGMRGLLMHFRGCSGEANRLARAYHSGETGDVAQVVSMLQEREPDTPLYAVGYSLGGNVLLKWLGETGNNNPLQAAVAVSVPFELNKAADRLNTGFSRLYQWWLVSGLKKFHQNKFKNRVKGPELKKTFQNFHTIRTFWEFDDCITAPLHGFKNAEDYYVQSSSRQYLKSICTPTLIIQAKDDPFLPVSAIPQEHELSPSVTLWLSETGGHVGFVQGKFPWRPEYWLEKNIVKYLKEVSCRGQIIC